MTLPNDSVQAEQNQAEILLKTAALDCRALGAARQFLEKHGNFHRAHGPAVLDSYNLEDVCVALLATALSEFANKELQDGLHNSAG